MIEPQSQGASSVNAESVSFGIHMAGPREAKDGDED